MRLIPFLALLLLSIPALAAPVPIDEAYYGTGAVATTLSKLLDSDPRDAIGGTFSAGEAGNLLFADTNQDQILVVGFPESATVGSILIEVTPGDPARMPERVDIFASETTEGDDWERLAADPRPSGTPLLYDGFKPVMARRLRFGFGVSEDQVGARIREIRVYSLGEAQLFPPLVPPPQWPEADHPGRVALEAWGWEGPITYQRESREGKDFTYLRGKVIDESYRWGANLFELYPPRFFPVAWPFDWKEDAPLKRPESYTPWEDARWTADALTSLSRTAHARGMLVQWFLHPEMVPDGGAEPTFADPEKVEKNLRALRHVAGMFGNAVADPWEDLFDGFGHEHWFLDAGGRTAMVGWEWNPGMYVYSTSNWHPFPEPAYAKSLMAAGSPFLRGRDDQWLLPGQRGMVPLSVQADARSRRAPEEIWGGMSRYGGGTYPDWMLKQANDFFRRRYMSGGRPDATALWWLGEPETVLPAEYRPYVYGVSQDPIRCAVTARLRTTGTGGYMDMMGRLSDAGIGRRYAMPATAYFIQNNYLRLYRDPTSDRTVLLFDPTRTAHYDGDSEAAVLASDFFRLETVEKEGGETRNVWTIGEENGSAAEFRPRYDLLVARSGPFDPARHSDEGRTVYSAGSWDGRSDDLAPEGGYTQQTVIDIADSDTKSPSLLAEPPRGPREIVLRGDLKAGMYRLEIGQTGTATADQVVFAVDGAPVGFLETIEAAVLEEAGTASALHVFEPVTISRDGEHEIALVLVGGDGFAIDAVRLAYMGPEKAAEEQARPYAADEFVRVGATATDRVPPGVGLAPASLPQRLHIQTALEPGTYELRAGILPGSTPSAADVYAGDEFVGSIIADGTETSTQVIPFCVSESGLRDLRIEAEGGAGFLLDFLSLDLVSPAYRTWGVQERAGHLAVLTETVTIPGKTGRLVEERRYEIASDSPFLRIGIQRSVTGSIRGTESFRADGYDVIRPVVREGISRSAKDVPIEAVWQAEGLPDLLVRASGAGRAGIEEGAFQILDRGNSAAGIVVAVLDGYMDLETVPGATRAPGADWIVEERWIDSPRGLDVVNPTTSPQVRIVRILNPPGGPYFVSEEPADGKRWWYFRGGQVSGEEDGTDLLKVYLPARGRARIVPDGLIDGIARPGWGCQYLMVLGDLARVDDYVSFVAEVMTTTPFVFAPRVEVPETVKDVVVNGEPYRYFDGNLVFLPNRAGRYRVEVTLGEPDAPYLTRTTTVVEQAKWSRESRSLEVRTALPEWCPILPEGMMPAALVDLAGREMVGTPGGEEGNREGNRVVIRYRDGLRVNCR